MRIPYKNRGLKHLRYRPGQYLRAFTKRTYREEIPEELLDKLIDPHGQPHTHNRVWLKRHK